MQVALVAILVVPLLATAVSAMATPAVSRVVTLLAGLASLALALSLVGPVADGAVAYAFMRVDALSEVFLLATAFLYAATALYCVGYLNEDVPQAEMSRYLRRFYVGMNVFAWSMLCAPMMDGLALLWVAIEVTTVVSALLVAIEDTEGATEAAWKYVLIASTGLGIALLATIFMYYAGAQVLGSSYDLSFTPLLDHAAELPHTPVRLAFVLALLGFGTKTGLVPVHTWLPDAHAEAPTPVSAMLSGSLLGVSFYAVIRYHQIAVGTLGETFPNRMLLVFGVASLLLASLYLLGQQDIKRMLAYSSVEHMGILAIGVSFGAPVAAAGVLLHVLAHAAGKGGAFMGAGIMVSAYGTKELSRIRDGLSTLPRSAPVFLLLILGLSGLPPSGIFRSEFEIVRGGMSSPHHVGASLLLVLVTVAFCGLALATTRIVCSPGVGPALAAEPSRWMLASTVICLLALVSLGVHPPQPLDDLLGRAALQLTGTA